MWFKKKQTEVKKEIVKQPTFYEVLAEWGKRNKNRKTFNAEEKFKQLFPRTIESVVPYVKKGKSYAMDSIFKPTRFNNDIPPKMLDFLNQTFIGWQACALLKQNPFIDRACSVPAEDAIAPDYTLSYINDDDAQKDKEDTTVDLLQDIKLHSQRDFRINEICAKHVINKRVYGYSLIVPYVDGADMELPYNIDGIKKGSYKGMAVVEPYWITPQLDEESATNPVNPHFYEPTWYVMRDGKRIHRSWVIRTVNSEVSDVLKPTYYFGGIPLTQQIFERVYAADKVANEAPLLALTKRLLIVDADISNAVANPQDVENTMLALTELRDNFGVFAKNQGDQVQQIDTSLSDFDALIMTQYQLVASIAGVPATKLLKTTPKGFNATGEFEQKDYNQLLLRIQENDYIPVINRHNELYTKSVYGKVIPLDVKFNPIDNPTEEEVAKVNELTSRTALNYIQAGVITAEEERDRIRNDDLSGYAALEEEIKEDDLGLSEAMDEWSEKLHPRDDDGRFKDGENFSQAESLN